MRNYFEMFELPADYEIDLTLLRQRYLKLQQLHHPDVTNEQEVQKQLASQEINFAYGVLKDDIKRAEHLLQLIGGDVDPKIQAAAFLEEIWQLLSDIQDCNDAAKLEKLLHEQMQRKANLVTQLRSAFASCNLNMIADKIAEAKYHVTIIKAIEDGIERAATN